MSILVADVVGSKTDLVFLSLVAGVAAVTLSRSKLTKSIRHRLIGTPFMIGDLVNCPFCMTHWTSMAIAIIFYSNSILEFIINSGILIAISALFIGILERIWFMQENEVADLQDLLSEARQALQIKFGQE